MRLFRRELRAAVGGLPDTFWAIWSGLLVNRLAAFVFSFLPIYLVRARGLGAAEAGRIMALFGVGFAAAGPLGGALADALGRRATMAMGLLCGALAAIGIAALQAPAAVAPLTFLAGLSELYRPAMAATVADVVPSADRPRAYALVHWAVNLGLAVGLLLAGLVVERSFVALFVADAATSLAFAAIVLLRVPETRPAGLAHEPALRGLARVARDGVFMLFLLIHLLLLVAFFQWQLGLPLDMAAHGLGPASYAALMAVNCAGVVLLQPPLASRLRHADPSRLLAATGLLLGLGDAVNAVGAGLAGYYVAMLLWTVAEVVGFPAATALVAELSPPALRGRYQGGYSMVFGLAFILAPLFGGELHARAGGRALWLACLALALIVTGGQLAAGGARRRRLASLASERDVP